MIAIAVVMLVITAPPASSDPVRTFTDWLGIVGGIAGIVVLFVGALVFVKGSYNKARIEALRSDNSDLRSRVEDLESALSRSEQREDKLEANVEHLKSENQMLVDMITQRANVEAIADLLEFHHKEAMKAWKSIKDILAPEGGGSSERGTGGPTQ